MLIFSNALLKSFFSQYKLTIPGFCVSYRRPALVLGQTTSATELAINCLLLTGSRLPKLSSGGQTHAQWLDEFSKFHSGAACRFGPQTESKRLPALQVVSSKEFAYGLAKVESTSTNDVDQAFDSLGILPVEEVITLSSIPPAPANSQFLAKLSH